MKTLRKIQKINEKLKSLMSDLLSEQSQDREIAVLFDFDTANKLTDCLDFIAENVGEKKNV